MRNLTVSLLIMAAITPTAIGESLADLREMLVSGMATLTSDIADVLDANGATIFDGSFNGGGKCTFVTWDATNDLVEIEIDGDVKTDITQFKTSTVVNFFADYVSGLPQSVGRITIDAEDNILLTYTDTTGQYRATVEEGDVVTAEVCLCSSANGGGQQGGLCTNAQCNTVEACPNQGTMQRWCNWRENSVVPCS